MKTKSKIIAVTTAALLLIGSFATLSNTGTADAHKASKKNERISMEQANKLALAIKPGTIKSVELEKDDGHVYYDYEILLQNKLFDIHIDAYSGKTLKVELEKVYKKVEGKENKKKKTATTNKQAKKRLTTEQAANIAAKHVQGTVEEIELDKDDGRFIYEIELRTKRGEVEVELDAYSGKILKVDYDDDDDDDHDD